MNMGKTYEEVFTGLATSVLGLDEQAVSALREADGSLKDDVLDVLKATDAARITKAKGDVDKELRDRQKLGKKEALLAFEKEVRDKFGSKSDKLGLALIEEVFAEKMPKPEGLTDEVVKRHPVYLDIETKYTGAKTEFEQLLDQKLKEKDAEHNRERTLAVVVDIARGYFDGLKPLLSKDPAKARNQRKLFEDEVRALNYQVETDNGGNRTFLLLDKDGKRLEDSHGHPVKVQEKWKAIAEQYYEFEASEDRSSAGSTDKASANGTAKKAYAVKKPANATEYQEGLIRILDEVKDPKEQAALTKALRELWQAG